MSERYYLFSLQVFVIKAKVTELKSEKLSNFIIFAVMVLPACRNRPLSIRFVKLAVNSKTVATSWNGSMFKDWPSLFSPASYSRLSYHQVAT